MPQTIFDPQTRQSVVRRLKSLTPTARPRWGRMNAPQMVAHLTDAYRMALGQLAVPSRRTPLAYTPFKQLVIYWLPFPKGAPAPAELFSRPPESWDAEIDDLITMMDGFDQLPTDFRFAKHPIFGELSHKTWGVLGYRHLDHHLRQFGV